MTERNKSGESKKANEFTPSFLLNLTQLAPGESREEFENLRKAIWMDLCPKGVLQERLATQIAYLDWRREHLDIFNDVQNAALRWAHYLKPGSYRSAAVLDARRAVLAGDLKKSPSEVALNQAKRATLKTI